MRLLITGGGTGGHVYPLLAVLQSLVAESVLDVANDVRYLGRAGSIEQRLANSATIPFVPLRVGGLRTIAPWTLALNLTNMVQASSQAGMEIAGFRPDAILATGGYVSAPAIWQGSRRKLPIVIYLPDLEPGWAIRVMSRWATSVAISFDESRRFFPAGKAHVTGYPVRSEFKRATKAEGRARFNLDSKSPVVTIFGGSQGAHSINEAVGNTLDELLQVTQLIHITGAQDEPVLQARMSTFDAERKSRYRAFAYLDEEMPYALAAADLVVARAGAATLGEFPALGVPSVLVPYPFAGQHQKKNAQFLVSRGAAVELGDAELGTHLFDVISTLIADKAKLQRMSDSARSLARGDAADNIAKLLLQIVTNSKRDEQS